MVGPFIGRQNELEILENLWSETRARMMVLYGRRRVGKSRLLQHWMQQKERPVIFWMAEPDTKEAHLRQFSQALFNYSSPGFPAPADFSYANWEQALAQIGMMAQKDRLGIIIDEFTFLVATDASIPGKLQHMWDQVLENTNLFLCLCGSHLGMMQREFLSDRAPLFGRASVKLHLAPLSFGLTGQYFPKYSAEDRMTLYTVFGGIPFYWDQINQSLTVEDNLVQKVFTPSSMLDAEARLLISDYVKELKNYVGILKAIGQGNHILSDIARATGLAANTLPGYLNILADAGYIDRFEPIIPLARSRRVGRYYFTDPFLRFYFRFIAGRATQLSLFEPDQALAEYQRHMPDFIGAHTWEEVCREWVLRASNKGELPLYPDEVRSAWSKDINIDVVGVNQGLRHMILGECKWTKNPVDAGVLKGLVTKAKTAMGGREGWSAYFLAFSKNGFTSSAHAFAEEIERQVGEVEWQVAGCRLVDLSQVDGDLGEWVR